MLEGINLIEKTKKNNVKWVGKDIHDLVMLNEIDESEDGEME